MSTAYNLIPVPDSCIRVFDLDAGSNGHFDAPVSGNLRVVNLKDKPEYAALSYVWGKESAPADTVQIGNNTIQVTTNCLSALRQLRQSNGAMTIWIDAICMDQSNKEEKEGQIPLMGDIYSQAEVTYIWLGPGNKRSNRAMEFLGEFPRQGMWHQGWYLIGRRPGGLVLTRFYRNLLIECLKDVLGRPWIQRLWTLQEILLSPKPIVLCGEKSVQWDQFTHSVSFLCYLELQTIETNRPVGCSAWFQLSLFALCLKQKRCKTGSSFSSSLIDKSSSDVVQNAAFRRALLAFEAIYLSLPLFFGLSLVPLYLSSNFISPRVLTALSACPILLILATIAMLALEFGVRGWTSQTSALPMSEAILWHIIERQATFAKDRYFGIAGVIRRDKQEKRMVRYSAKLEETYRAMFVELYDWTKSGDILLFPSKQRFARAPSWVPDWRAVETSWIKMRYSTQYRHAQSLPKNCFSGTVIEPVVPFRIRNGKELILQGTIIANIGRIVRSFPGAVDQAMDEENLNHIRRMQQLFNGMSDNYRQILYHYLWIALEMRADLPDRSAAAVGATLPQEWSARMFARPRHRYHREFTLASLQEAIPVPHARFKTQCWNVWDQHMKLMNRVCQIGCLARCYGQYNGCGIAPKSAREEDVVALISGVSMPIVLRRAMNGSAEFNFVGPALFGDLMNGECTYAASDMKEIVVV